MTGLAVPYGIRRTTPDDAERKSFSDVKKMIFEREEDRAECPLLARFFGKFLCTAREIRVYGANSRDASRFPTACSYSFPSDSREDTRLPARFDYATCLLAVPVTLIDANDENTREAAVRVARDVERESRPENGHGHPGLTNDEEELVVLRRRAWRDVAEDVVATPYREGYEKDWFPALREDGRAGLYFAPDGGAYVVVDNALPHFACDQLRMLFSENPKNLSWEEWTSTEPSKRKTSILDRAVELSGAVAEGVASRIVEALASRGLLFGSGERDERNGTVKTRVFVNRLVRLNDGETRYDAGILRGTHFHSHKGRGQKGLFRVGDDGYALVAKNGFQNRDEDVFPAFARDEEEMRAIVASKRGYSDLVFLGKTAASN